MKKVNSCVWYFREVIDEIGMDQMQEKLNRLQYGNCDISDWAGHLNTNNSNPVLTGFWIESSLLISPKEQTEVMERIFGGHDAYSEETLTQLKQVMLITETAESDISIYGKTGMGKAYGVVVDAWYSIHTCGLLFTHSPQSGISRQLADNLIDPLPAAVDKIHCHRAVRRP